MHSTKSIFILLIAFASVAAIGGYFAGKITTEPIVIETEAPAVKPAILKTSQGPVTEDTLRLNRALTENERLRKEIEALKASIADGEAERAAIDAEMEGATLQDVVNTMMPPTPEQLKAEDAEAHERMMQNIRHRQQRMAHMRQQRIDFLSGIDTTLLTPEEQATHQAYIQAVKQHAAMEAAVFESQMNDQPLTEEALMAMRESAMAVRELQNQERTALLNAVGAMWNVPEENLSSFVNMVEEVNAVLGGEGGRGGMFGGGPMIFMNGGPGGRGPRR
jgi:hypothetical protein